MTPSFGDLGIPGGLWKERRKALKLGYFFFLLSCALRIR